MRKTVQNDRRVQRPDHCRMGDETDVKAVFMVSSIMAKPKPAGATNDRAQAAIESALRTLEAEGSGVDALGAALRDGLSASFAAAVEVIRAAQGRVIVTGMGKSGHVGRKIASTFASTGTPAFFVHPGEASHGDLGMIGNN